MNLVEAVIATLKYSDHFGFPLTASEIFSRLIFHKTTKAKLAIELNKLLKAKAIGQKNGYYHLAGRSSLVTKRQSKLKSSQNLLKRAKRLTTRIHAVPGVLAIYLTGSLAVNNSGRSDDIDLMIITKEGKLWTTRLLLTVYTTLLGLRRTPSSRHNAGKLCLNLYLSPSAYGLPTSRRSLYTAYELIQAVPLYDPHNTQNNLLATNYWLKKYLPNFELPLKKSKIINRKSYLSTRFIEWLAYHLQFAYMNPRITRELITPNSAFFHPNGPSLETSLLEYPHVLHH